MEKRFTFYTTSRVEQAAKGGAQRNTPEIDGY